MPPTQPGAYSDVLVNSSLTHMMNTVGTQNLPNAVHAKFQADAASQESALTRASAQAQYEEDSKVAQGASLVSSINDNINTNNYISNILAKEQTRVTMNNAMVKNEQYKLRKKVIELRYLQVYYQTATKVIILSMYVTIALLLAMVLFRSGTMSSITFVTISAVLLLSYLLYMVYIARKTALISETSDGRVRWPVAAKLQSQLNSSGDGGNQCDNDDG